MNFREFEQESIRAFVHDAAKMGCFKGRVLDYGSGKQPYRPIVEQAQGIYFPYDRLYHPATVADDDVGQPVPLSYRWDCILCTQVLQYVHDPPSLLEDFLDALKEQSGWLILTGPTNWPVVEKEDLYRFTPSGITYLLEEVGFRIRTLVKRVEFDFGGDKRWLLGWGVIAHA